MFANRLALIVGTAILALWVTALCPPDVLSVFLVGSTLVLILLATTDGRSDQQTVDASPAEEENGRRLLADTAHELRNPLAAVWANLDLLKKELPLQLREEVLADCDRDLGRMRRLVEDLLTLEGAGQEDTIHRRSLCLDFLAQEETRRIEAANPGRIFSVHSREPVMIKGDPDDITRVLSNIFHNAVRYSDTENDPILVEVWKREGAALLAVQDHGVGIAAEHHQRIFDRLYRVDEARTRCSGGTGLGLSIAKALTEKHGGTILVESQQGVGSRFTLRFPVAGDNPNLEIVSHSSESFQGGDT